MNADKVGPRKTATGIAAAPSKGLLNGRRPAPSGESMYGSHVSHEPA
jgi:hypothetical protein